MCDSKSSHISTDELLTGYLSIALLVNSIKHGVKFTLACRQICTSGQFPMVVLRDREERPAVCHGHGVKRHFSFGTLQLFVWMYFLTASL